jgi:perosamine synthetase
MKRLAADGIEAGHYVPCVHLQPYMRERYGFGEGLCPVAEDAASRTLALPFFTGIDAEDQDRVVAALSAAL